MNQFCPLCQQSNIFFLPSIWSWWYVVFCKSETDFIKKLISLVWGEIHTSNFVWWLHGRFWQMVESCMSSLKRLRAKWTCSLIVSCCTCMEKEALWFSPWNHGRAILYQFPREEMEVLAPETPKHHLSCLPTVYSRNASTLTWQEVGRGEGGTKRNIREAERWEMKAGCPEK